MINREATKNYSSILMEQQLLCLICYYFLVFLLLFLSYIQKIYLLLFFVFFGLDVISIIFIRIIIYLISLIIPISSWCHRTIAMIFEQIIHWRNNIKIFCIVYEMFYWFLLCMIEMEHCFGRLALTYFLSSLSFFTTVYPWL